MVVLQLCGGWQHSTKTRQAGYASVYLLSYVHGLNADCGDFMTDKEWVH